MVVAEVSVSAPVPLPAVDVAVDALPSVVDAVDPAEVEEALSLADDEVDVDVDDALAWVSEAVPSGSPEQATSAAARASPTRPPRRGGSDITRIDRVHLIVTSSRAPALVASE
ncbi:MAG: hypothetical protein R3B09_31190 [Nannocystaceae bacterium]